MRNAGREKNSEGAGGGNGICEMEEGTDGCWVSTGARRKASPAPSASLPVIIGVCT